MSTPDNNKTEGAAQPAGNGNGNNNGNGNGNGKAAKRRRLMLSAIGFFVIVGAVYGGYHYWESLRYAYTDDAYVQGNLVQVTPQVGGTVIAIDADDTQLVKAG
ncbi:MAG: EmrA/EmrK family multidrug efflux transporter periplasmic adaptor subunit, partial [Thiomonas sp.]|nr:EmrA/EmrK family multidrug efflux transporter periplasmic adaptor subunit [Thiomonas sp.]